MAEWTEMGNFRDLVNNIHCTDCGFSMHWWVGEKDADPLKDHFNVCPAKEMKAWRDAYRKVAKNQSKNQGIMMGRAISDEAWFIFVDAKAKRIFDGLRKQEKKSNG